MALLAGAHTWQRWRSSPPLSFCPLVASIFFLLCFNQLSLQSCFKDKKKNKKKTIDIHLWVFGIEALACVVATAFFFFFLFVAVERIVSVSSCPLLSFFFCLVYAVWSMCRRRSVTGASRSEWGTWNASWRRRTRSCYGWVTAEASCQGSADRASHSRMSATAWGDCGWWHHVWFITGDTWPHQYFTHSVCKKKNAHTWCSDALTHSSVLKITFWFKYHPRMLKKWKSIKCSIFPNIKPVHHCRKQFISSLPVFLRCVTQLTIQTWLMIKSTQSRLIVYL